jgi:regulatory protein
MPVDTAHAGAAGRPLPPRAAAADPPTATALTPDAAKHLEQARKLAWRSLNRRERTAAELRERLAAKEIEPWAIDQVLDDLREQRYVDDAGYARRFADDRRRLDGWGSERIERRLRELGVEDDAIGPALAEQDPEAELEAALALLEQRFPAAPQTRRDRDRALAVLVRKGYALELATDALRRHGGADELE